MDYEATLDKLYRLERFGMKLGLENMRRFLDLLGNPHEGLRAIHVTGSNGKGSVSAFAASALRKAGYRVGLFTSPHLVRFNERIQVDGEPISDADVLRLWEGVQAAMQAMTDERAVNRPTFFEVATAMAFLYFQQRQVDLGVIEVGMGGRLDATNVIQSDVAVVTRVDLEHTEHLGKTVDRIAREKAGIIKPVSRAVTVEQQTLPVLEARCRGLGVPLDVVGRSVAVDRDSFDLSGERIRVRGAFGEVRAHIPLLGAFQVENAALAVAALDALRQRGPPVTNDDIAAGLESVRWPGRLQILRQDPLVVVDGAHNGAAARALQASLRELFPDQQWHLVIGALNDKNLEAIAEALAPLAARVYACRSKSHRAYAPEEVAAVFRRRAETAAYASSASAIDAALSAASPKERVLVTGSIYSVGEAFDHFGLRP